LSNVRDWSVDGVIRHAISVPPAKVCYRTLSYLFNINRWSVPAIHEISLIWGFSIHNCNLKRVVEAIHFTFL
jgi:hypothetical protein